MNKHLAYSGKHISVDVVDYEDWVELYPHVILQPELRFMDDWLSEHPKRRGTVRFIKNWLKAEERKATARNAEARVGAGPSLGTVRVKPEYLARVKAK